jgi:hypothetical protein
VSFSVIVRLDDSPWTLIVMSPHPSIRTVPLPAKSDSEAIRKLVKQSLVWHMCVVASESRMKLL